MSWLGDLFEGLFGGGDNKETSQTQTTELKQLPDYPEASQARSTWGNILQQWMGQPGFGAIQPDWNSIWKNAAGKVQRYFQGGPEGPGLVAGVKSNLAARNMSENPASNTQIANLGIQEGNQLQDIATQQATQEAQLAESGRMNWLNSIMSLAGLKPQFGGGTTTSTGNTTYTPSTASLVAPLGSLAGGAVANSDQSNGFMQSIANLFRLGGSPGSGTIGAADESDMMSFLEQLLPLLGV